MEIDKLETSLGFRCNFLEKLQLTEEQEGKILSCFRKVEIPKRHFFLNAGQITNQKAYLNKGVVRTFKMDNKGGEHTLFFSFEDWWVGDFESYIKGTPSTLQIQALEDCEFLCISKDDCERFMNEYPSFKQFFDKKYESFMFSMMERLVNQKTFNHEERYKQLINDHPYVFDRIPLHYIASYLNIAPQSLSRLRRRILLKK